MIICTAVSGNLLGEKGKSSDGTKLFTQNNCKKCKLEKIKSSYFHIIMTIRKKSVQKYEIIKKIRTLEQIEGAITK